MKYEVIERATGSNHGTHRTRAAAEKRIGRLVAISNGRRTAADWEIREVPA